MTTEDCYKTVWQDVSATARQQSTKTASTGILARTWRTRLKLEIWNNVRLQIDLPAFATLQLIDTNPLGKSKESQHANRSGASHDVSASSGWTSRPKSTELLHKTQSYRYETTIGHKLTFLPLLHSSCLLQSSWARVRAPRMQTIHPRIVATMQLEHSHKPAA
jgi:hypothetical protein